MQLSRYISRILLLGALAQSAHSAAQQRKMPSVAGPASAQGQLTVSLTVVASVGIIFDSYGEPRLMEANSISHSDNVSWIQSAQPSVVKTVLRPVTAEIGRTKQKRSPSKPKH